MNTKTLLEMARLNSVSALGLCGELACDWAASQPHIGPANNARIKAVLETGEELQNKTSLIVTAVNEYEALCKVAEAARNIVDIGDMKSLINLADSLDTLNAIRKGAQ